MEIDHVRMISPSGEVSKISQFEACHLRDTAFMRGGHVQVAQIPNGYSITDSKGTTILTAIYKDPP